MSEACITSIQGRSIHFGDDYTTETYRLTFESLTYPYLNCTCLLMIRDPTLLQELGLCRVTTVESLCREAIQWRVCNLGLSVQMERFFLQQGWIVKRKEWLELGTHMMLIIRTNIWIHITQI